MIVVADYDHLRWRGSTEIPRRPKVRAVGRQNAAVCRALHPIPVGGYPRLGITEELPHRQFVFTMPKALRPFFRHDRRLFAEVSRLIYDILAEFHHEAAGARTRR